MEAANWKTLPELKQTFNSADDVEGRVVFNIGGNKYRLITVIQYELSLVIIQRVLTHEEYDRGGWK